MKEKAFIHCFSTNNHYYVYDVNTNSILRINKEIYVKLNEHTDIETLLDDKIVQMREQGFLRSNNPLIKIEHPLTDTLKSQLENNVELLILQVTQNCNFRCEYCVYSGSYVNRVHSKKRMSLETAKKAVDFYYNHCKNTKSAQIGFYGGEPLLEIELIKEIVEYSKILFRGKEIIFNMTTNASLLDDDKIDFLATNNFNLTISLDGPENVQNSGRKFAGSLSGTYQVVIDNIAKIEERHPEYIKNISFNAVLGTDSNFLDSSNYFTFDYRPNNLVTAVNVSDKDAIDPIMYSDEFRLNYFYEVFKSYLWGLDRIEEQDVSKLVRSYIKTIKTDIHDRLQLNTIRTIKCHPSGPCLAGVNRLFVTVEGDFFPCERVNETSKAYNIGNLDEGFWYDKSYELLNIGKLTERECRECWAINFCNCCAAGIEEGDKLSRKKRLEKCKSNKHVVEERLKEYCTLREYVNCLGVHSFPTFMFQSLKDESEKIIAYNNYIKYLSEMDKPDIFVLGVPGGILPITRRQPEHFGVSAFEVFNSVKPDYMIFNLYNADVESKYLSEIKMLMRYRFDVDIDAFYISNYIQDGLSLNTYMPIKYIRQEQHDVEEKWQKFGEGIYYKSKIALLVENLIQTLNGYKEIDIL